MNGAEIIVESLKKEGVSMVFGYPGTAICPLYDALYQSDIRHVLVRQEQNAAHMASGYARADVKPSVCIATSGPGATNLITGIATAFMDSIPMVAITGQISTDLLGTDGFQEADITGACASFTKHSYLVQDVSELARIMKEAFYISGSGRPGPVLVDIPEEVQKNTIEKFVYPRQVDIAGYKPKTEGHPMQIKRAAEAIMKAERPVICCGGGVVLSGAREELTLFAEKSGVPIVSTMMGIGVMPMDSPIYLGMIGRFGRSYANRSIREADLIILCGARVGDRAITLPDQVAGNATIIHIDIDPAEIGKNMRVDIPIVGDVKQVLARLSAMVDRVECDEWREKVSGYKRSYKPYGENREDFVEPRSFIRDLSVMMEENAILVADVGQSQIWAARNFSQKEGRFLTSGGLGTMGYALPAAVGAKLARPNRQVVAICGDGAFQMTMCELATAADTKVPLKLILMDNRRLGMVRERQDRDYQSRHSGTHLSGNPDFAALCRAYGMRAEIAGNNTQAKAFAKEMLMSDKPFVLVCRVDPDTPTIR